ncbi:MAG: division/cell wall cluster transcriptional repressor MraZ [Vicinamibacterales bacterium]
MFRGSAPARVDDKGRLKMPSVFKSLLESKYGRELYLTSLTGEYVRIYPMPVWVELEQKLALVPSTNPSKLRFLDRVNYYGQSVELDSQDRALIPVRLRDAAIMVGDVDVLGQISYFDVWNHDRFLAKLQQDPFTDQDARTLSEFGI